MKQTLFLILISLLFSTCKNRQSDSIIHRINKTSVKYDISKIDSLIKSELVPIDSIIFNKYIAKNPVILGDNYDIPRLYADGFWIKKFADSIKYNIIFNTFSKSKYYYLKNPLKQDSANAFMILIIYKSENITIVEHYALYLITLDSRDFYPSTVLLAEKIKGGGFTSIDLLTTSIIKDSKEIEQITIEQSCILDLPGPKGETTCNYDTSVTYFKITDRNTFYPYKRKVSWEIK